MKNIIASIIGLLLTFQILAQEPDWLDPVSRASKYPQEQYLTAFGTEVLGKKQSETEAQAQLYEIIKSQISDAILVSINAQTSLNITVENADTDQKMERRSASSSEVELVGLKLDSYYEKRRKSLHAFGYVSIEELAKYHRKNMMEKSLQIDQNLSRVASSTSKTEKVKLHVLNKQLLSDIQKSARLLTALSEPHGTDISSLQVTANSNEEKLYELFHSGTIILEHLVTRLSGELLNNIPKGSNISVASAPFSYSNSEVSSAFSDAIQNQLANELSESSKITLSAGSKGQITGTFLLNDSEVIFNASVVNTKGDIISTTEFSTQTNLIDTKGLKLLPPNFEFIPDLSKISIAGPETFSVKPSAFTTQPIVLTYTLDNKAVPNLPITFSIATEGSSNSYSVLADVNGKAVINLDESMVIPGTDYLVTAAIDLPEFLSVAKENPFIEYIYDNQSIPSKEIALSVLSPLVFITSTEEGINGPLNVNVLEPAVKSGLSELRYAFTEDIAKADYELKIEAQARKGQAGEIATLTFVDATISLINKLTGKEIYKNSFFNIKGIGANFEVAQSSAFQKTRTQMVDDITYELEYNR